MAPNANGHANGYAIKPKKVVATKKKSSFLSKWFTLAVLVAAFVSTCRWLDSIKVCAPPLCASLHHLISVQERFYVFDPESLHELAQAAIAAAPSPDATSSMVDYIVANLTATYPATKVALNQNTSEWMFNNAGGAMGAMYIIHASITEYLIIFGTPVGTEGHTGMHTADDYFNILVGEQWAFAPPNLQMERYPAGSVHHLRRGQMKQYKMHEGCFALEYARGVYGPCFVCDAI